MIETLWKRHYCPGLTGSFHGDMADAWVKMLADPECDMATARKIRQSAESHMRIERLIPFDSTKRKWFCEKFGSTSERVAV